MPTLMVWFFLFHILAASLTPQYQSSVAGKEDILQDVVSWDQSSIMIRGERMMFLSAEFHPWRLPSPGLWLDVFQKVKALGFSGVSFYLNWALLEGEPGHVRTDGVFALEEFFDAAKEAGIYLWARPGPYINSEVSGGGLPGWLQRNKARLRSTEPGFLNATKNYIAHVGSLIKGAEITQGGPVILFQPENEYSLCSGSTGLDDINSCLDKGYMEFMKQEYRKSGITLPMHSNDGYPLGNFRPGSGLGEVDIYGFDFYPFGWGQTACSNPSDWDRMSLPPSVYLSYVRNISLPKSPRSIVEFQGGSPDKWGGVGTEQCAALINEEFERIFYKMNYALKVTVMNIYMTFGGTNWGNIGHSEGYTSYDVGAAIGEDRSVSREKYAELKLQANFFRVSPAYLTAQPLLDSVGSFTSNKDLVTTPLLDIRTGFYIIRHVNFQTFNSTSYRLEVPTSLGLVKVPQLGGSLVLHGRDSKIHVVDYDIDGLNLIYSSAEIFTWAHHGSKRVLILYGGEEETHEFALPVSIASPNTKVTGVKYDRTAQAHIIHWRVRAERTVLSFGEELDVYLLWRNDAYQYWSLDLPAPAPLGLYPSPSRHTNNATAGSVIIKAGYLLRKADISGQTLHLSGDINSTTDVEIISTPVKIASLTFNNHSLNITENSAGNPMAVLEFQKPDIRLPDLSSLQWAYHDSLPEIQSDYDDSAWKSCNLTTSNNPRNLTTPTSLYASDYGYHAGSFIYRGHFIANGGETTFSLTSQGASAYGHSVWINGTFLGSFVGEAEATNHTQIFGLELAAGQNYVFTVLIDHMGLDLNFWANTQPMKNPRGILDYSISGRPKDAVQWKMTGNLRGEQYWDKSRGPLNEGAMFAERQGLHLPGAPTNGSRWESRSPLQGLSAAGVGIFSTELTLALPNGYDIPLNIELGGGNATHNAGNFRVQIYVNGWQFGKFINNIGPQTSFPIPEGIINHKGCNYIALTLWALDAKGARLTVVGLSYDKVIQSGYRPPYLVKGSRWKKRTGAY